jgi:hypothetical protein
MVPFCIEGLGDTQHITRTINNAKFASLAAILYDDNLALRRLDGVQV